MFSKQDFDIMTLNSKPSGLEQKLCNPHSPLVLSNAILFYSHGTPKITFPASSPNHITLLRWFHFLSHQAQVVYPPFNSLSLPLAIHLPSLLLPYINKGCQLYYLLVSSKGCGLRLCWVFFVCLFFKKKEICYPYTYRKLTVVRLSVCWDTGLIH